ncbi:TMV resistance protein N [Glycine soja]|uniref:TMV resistance protein N n=1 Tax=Glycine soja TaxID=3848 RepID=A0A0B2S374_GLYSO|nr:TMV resistance protein N [Glycine soja]
MAMQSSSSSFSYRFSNDLFLSFRGEDTRRSFTGNLYKALSDRGIHTFMDDKKIPRGDQITSGLEKEIEESRIFIIVLSKNYASSSFYLNELDYILKFIKGKGLLVLPVFYKVDPSDVRNHASSYGESLANHEKKFNADKETFNFDSSQHLTQMPDVSCIPHLENLSFMECYNLFAIHQSVGLLKKLRILDAEGCLRLKYFTPIKLTSLEQLKLGYCHSLESFPEILGKMENITDLDLRETPVKKFPSSLRNLTRLHTLCVGWEGCLFRKEDDGAENVSSTTSSKVQYLDLRNCNLSDDFFPIALPCFANVMELNLHLREIRGIPPNLKHFFARECLSLTSSCRSMLLNQELHEAGRTCYLLPRAKIPEWFEFQTSEFPISFWFHNKLPAIAICHVIEQVAEFSSSRGWTSRPSIITNMIINGNANLFYSMDLGSDCSVLFDPQDDKESYMEDIRFLDPCRKTKLDNDFNSSKPENQRWVGNEVAKTQVVLQQQLMGSFLSRMWHWPLVFLISCRISNQ